MKIYCIAVILTCLSACAAPNFVSDGKPIPVTETTPDYFELPARFAVARIVYNRAQAAGAKEAIIWDDLADRASGLGSFSPLITREADFRHTDRRRLVEVAREQRYDYLLSVRMHPATGSADIALLHTGSGGIMATARAVSPAGGQRGFWGGDIRNPRRLDRVTLRIADAAAPVVEDVLRGVANRQANSN